MPASRLTIPSYQQVFGQDEFDHDLDNDARSRNSADMGRYDPESQETEDDHEKLIRAQKANPWREDGSPTGEASSSHSRSARPQRSGHRDTDEKAGLVHDDEAPRYSSSADSMEFETEKFEFVPPHQPSRIARIFKRYVLPSVLSVLFIIIAFGAYRASSHHYIPSNSSNSTQLTDDLKDSLLTSNTSTTTSDRLSIKSNGTALFAPTTILISLDGFRADFLQRGLTPTLNYFINQGVSPKYMTPSFPSVTFPNHYTMVTGLYPESHGVVGNTFWDPTLQVEFSYHDRAHSMQPEWWTGEPIWLTAEQQGVITATHMWPGSEAHIGDIEPMYVDAFNGTEQLNRKVQRVFEMLDKPGLESPTVEDQRPQLVLAYVPNVDADGHKYGPNSTEITQTIRAVDDMLYTLLDGLKQRNLTDIVNVVVVSDHGMATTSTTRLVQLEDIVDLDLIEHIDGWPHYGLRPYSKDPEVLEMIYNRLLTETATHDGFDVFLRDKTMPERYHFSNNERIAPLWLIAKTGWAIVTKEEFDIENALPGDEYHPRGIHGYDHEDPLMRAIFVARGPAFPHEKNSRVAVFQNTEVYNIVCDSVGVTPVANNGTLRLPFETMGLHSDFDDDEEENLADPPVTDFVPQLSTIYNIYGHHSHSLPGMPQATTTGVLDALATGVDGVVSMATGAVDAVATALPTRVFGDVRPTGVEEDAALETGAIEDEVVDYVDYSDEDEDEDEDENVPTVEDAPEQEGVERPSVGEEAEVGSEDEDDFESIPEDEENVQDESTGETQDDTPTVEEEDDAGIEDDYEIIDEPEDEAEAEAEDTLLPTDDDDNLADSASTSMDDDVVMNNKITEPVDDDNEPTSNADADLAPEEEQQEEKEEQKSSWLGWFGEKFGDVRDWVGGLFGGGGEAVDGVE